MGGELWITEKVDGTNVRFAVVDGAIIYGTHHTILGPLESIPRNHLHRVAAELIASKMAPDDLNPNYVYYAEAYGGSEEETKAGRALHHTIRYPAPVSVVGIDIWLWAEAPSFLGGELRGRFIRADLAKAEFERLGLPYVPILYSGRDHWSHESLRSLLVSSQMYPGVPEGICVKSYDAVNKWGRQLFAKLVRDEFKEQLKAAWGSPASASVAHPEPGIVEAYVTPARIAKKFHEVVGAGAEPSMKLVPIVGKLVFEDYWEENWRTLIYDIRQPLDLGVLRAKTFAAVARHLKRMLSEATV